MKRFLFWLTSRLPCRIICDHDGTPYLERYYLFTLFGVRAYVHRFVASDPGRGLHDHPWPWAVSIVLSGFYFEETRSGVAQVRWVNGLVGDSFHRVLLPNAAGSLSELNGSPNGRSRSCWTLFAHRAAYVKPWGFLRLSPDEDKTVWVPFNHPGNGVGTNDPWWLRSPRGCAEPRRMPREE